MQRALVKQSPVKPPKELAQFFADPPLALNEKREDYEQLFAAIAAAAKPADAIAWMFVRDITDLSWEIRRERNLKVQIIKTAEEAAVAKMLTPPRPVELDFMAPTPGVEEAEEAARQWASDPKARRRIDKELADMDCDASFILSEAINGDSDERDAIDRRIASYELRRMAALRAIEHYSETLARRLQAASDVIEGQFTEAAE